MCRQHTRAAADDVALAARSAEGHLDAFNELVERRQDLAFGVAFRIVANAATAEDIVQDAFIAAYRAIASFCGGSFRGWLLRIVANDAHDALRRHDRHPTTSLTRPAGEGDGEEMAIDPPGTETPTEESALRGELAEHINQAIQRLPVDQRTVITMIDIHGLSYEETAEAAGVNIGTVKSRLNRGRLRLRELLRESEELPAAAYRHVSVA